MKVVVTGGSGDLGSRVLEQLRWRGVESLSASRRTGVDLSTGTGLDAVLEGAHAVVHCADNPARAKAVTVGGTRMLAHACATAGSRPHLVHISIVGCDQNPYPYYRAKARAEVAISRSGADATVVRATQFHSLTAFFARTFTRGRFVFVPGGMAFQPVDVDWVAARLTDLATGPRSEGFTRSTELAGPDLLPLAAVAALVRRHAGRPAPRRVPVPVVGGVLHALDERTNVPGPGAQTGGAGSPNGWTGNQRGSAAADR